MATSNFSDTANFKLEEETVNTNLKSGPPACILAQSAPNPDRATLTEQELIEARMKLWNNRFLDLKFPRERKFRIDPSISGQSIGLISFSPSKDARPDPQGCFGVLKLRGNFTNQSDAERYGAMLMRKYDSYAEYDLVRVGQDFPLMLDNSIYTEETKEVNIKAVVDDISLSFIRKKKEEERQQREEVETRSRKLISKDTEEDRAESLNDLEFYTTMRTKKAHCQHVIDQSKEKLEEAKTALAHIIEQIEELDGKFPDYKTQYISQYDNALKSIGTDASQNPLMKYMKADVASISAPSVLPVVVEEASN